jgi:3-hydroxyisobutyrate dehydrogenase-like beta-hydroxyacid dehydrogenase
VTASASVDAARAVATHLSAVPYFLDINSVSPQRKQETAALLANRARYVDVAVMGPIHPERHRTPMLLAGPHAGAIEPLLAGLGMRISVAGPQIGAAAAIKMVRSVMIKGIEALTLECFLAARRAGVEDQVMASLSASFPTLDWPRLILYNLERMARHGVRRAAEMDEVAATLRELGVEPLMTAAAAERQRELGKLGAQANVRTAVQATVKDALEAVSAATRRAAGNGSG